jgi:hypothetical protein
MTELNLLGLLKERWPQISSKAGIVITLLPSIVTLPTWASISLIVIGIVCFGLDEKVLITSHLKRKR